MFGMKSFTDCEYCRYFSAADGSSITVENLWIKRPLIAIQTTTITLQLLQLHQSVAYRLSAANLRQIPIIRLSEKYQERPAPNFPYLWLTFREITSTFLQYRLRLLQMESYLPSKQFIRHACRYWQA